MEEITQPKVNRSRWHFWFLITFSILLIVVFVFYLPLRFQSSTQEHEESPSLMEEDEHLNVIDFLFPVARADEGHDEEEIHGSEQLKPLVSPVWWLLLIVSLITTAILSLGIYKFIHVKK